MTQNAINTPEQTADGELVIGNTAGRPMIGLLTTTGGTQIVNGAGTIALGSESLENEQTGVYTADETDRSKVIRFTGAGGVDLNLTAAATLTDGWFAMVRNDSAGNITIVPDGAETINGGASLVLLPTESTIVYTNGTLFYTVAYSDLSGFANTELSNLGTVALNVPLDLPDGSTAVTQTPSDNSTKLATTAYVDANVFTLPGYTAAAAGNPTELQFFEETVNGVNYTQIKAQDAIGTNGDFVLPANTATMYALAVSSLASNQVPALTTYVPTFSGVGSAGTGYKTGSFPFPCYVAGGYALPFLSTGRDGTGISVSNDVLYLTLIYVPMGDYTTVTINIILADVSATADVDVAIFSPNTSNSNSPVGARLVNATTISNINTTGEKTATFSSTTMAGWYWVALRPDNIGTALTIDACSGANIQGFNASNSKTGSVSGYTYTGQTSMPSTLATVAPSTYLGVANQLHVAVSP